MSITESELDQLFSLLESDLVPEDTLDFYSVHGLMTAAVISPVAIAETDRLEMIFDDLSNIQRKDWFIEAKLLLNKLKLNVQEELLSEETIELPFDPEPEIEDSDMQAWCCGFMEVVFFVQEQWFSGDEDTTSTLMLPIETGSGLFESEDEFQTIISDKKLLMNILNQIPEVLTDLYLFFHAPQDKKKAH